MKTCKQQEVAHTKRQQLIEGLGAKSEMLDEAAGLRDCCSAWQGKKESLQRRSLEQVDSEDTMDSEDTDKEFPEVTELLQTYSM